MSYYLGFTGQSKGLFFRAERVELKVGDVYKCPEGHKANIVWISEDKKVIAVKCPRKQ